MLLQNFILLLVYWHIKTSSLYYKHITIINYDSGIVNKLGASLPDDARVVIYDRHVFIVQATGVDLIKL